jgi:hypothetical protein
MKNIVSFDSYNKLSEGYGGGYPAGAQYDPNAPWNQSDPETQRGTTTKKEDIIFDVVGSDYSEFALLKHKRDGKYYLAWFDPTDDDFREHMEVAYEVVGRDEDGYAEYEYDWDSAEVDEESIAAYFSAEAKYDPKKMGVGLEAFEDGLIAEVDEELAKDFLTSVETWTERYKHKSPQYRYQGIAKSLERIAEVLREFIPEEKGGLNEGEGIHPAVRQILIDFLEENPKSTYAEARNHISNKIKGWKLSEEDFEEAKSL